jgi:hypothetical protein
MKSEVWPPPASLWNGKLLMESGGGLAGSINTAGIIAGAPAYNQIYLSAWRMRLLTTAMKAQNQSWAALGVCKYGQQRHLV